MSKVVISDPEIMGGTPVFRGTRVPVAVLFDNMLDGVSLETILEQWPSLVKEDVLEALQNAPYSLARDAA
jgi:uncharacterized protein (DUF433 family)